jgi:hypothetical protein
MHTSQLSERDYSAIAWGALFVWWGLTVLLPGLPDGAGALGVGLILLGVNAARALNRLPVPGLTTTLGILALVLGGLELANAALQLPFDLPVFAILLLTLGTILLGREALRQNE